MPGSKREQLLDLLCAFRAAIYFMFLMSVILLVALMASFLLGPPEGETWYIFLLSLVLVSALTVGTGVPLYYCMSRGQETYPDQRSP